MLVIANNITTRSAKVNRVFQQLKTTAWSPEQPPAMMLKELAERCIAAGADVLDINIQQHYDRPEAMEFAVKAVQEVTDHQLCLSTANAEALEAGLRACRRFPLVNYISIDKVRLQKMLPLVAKHGAEVLLLITDPTMPADAEEMLKKSAILVGAANEMGIPNDRILIDPGLFHISSDMGQRHLVEVMEFLRALPEVFEPPVRTSCWIDNASAGAPTRLRPAIATALLAMLAGLGLSSTFLDVLKRENMRMVRLIRVLKNEAVYAHQDIEL